MGSPDNLIQEYKHLSNEKKEMVYHIALKYLKRDEESAKDVTQEVLLKWYQYIKSGNEIKHLDAWLAIVTKNTALTYKEQLDMQLEIKEKLSGYERNSPSAEDEVIVLEETTAKGNPILGKLYEKNPRWYEAVILAYFMEWKHKDIADHFGVSEDALNMVLYRAIKWCRKNCDLSER